MEAKKKKIVRILNKKAIVTCLNHNSKPRNCWKNYRNRQMVVRPKPTTLMVIKLTQFCPPCKETRDKLPKMIREEILKMQRKRKR